jgi:DNA-binding response OmpR family regulator
LALIALSGRGDAASKRRATEAGFDQYLVKPTSIVDLADALASVPARAEVCER